MCFDSTQQTEMGVRWDVTELKQSKLLSPLWSVLITWDIEYCSLDLIDLISQFHLSVVLTGFSDNRCHSRQPLFHLFHKLINKSVFCHFTTKNPWDMTTSLITLLCWHLKVNINVILYPQKKTKTLTKWMLNQ